MDEPYDLAVIGAGVAGLSAAMFGARLGLRTVLVDRVGLGGELINAGTLDSVPGLGDSTSGADMVGRLSEQVMALGVDPELAEATHIDAADGAFRIRTDGRELSARAAIVATGAEPRRLGVPGEESLTGRGVSHCAVCDGAFFRGQDVVVAGGGDAAYYAARYLAQQCREVLLVHRGPRPRAAAFLRREVDGLANVRVIADTVLTAIRGGDAVGAVAFRDAQGVESERPASGVFVCVGLAPRGELLRGVAELDTSGRAVVDGRLGTSQPGLYAAGSVRAGSPEQIVTAAADGCNAAYAAFDYIQERRAT